MGVRGEAEISSPDISGSMAAALSLSLRPSVRLSVAAAGPEPLFPPIITGKLFVRGCDRRRRGREGEERANFLKKLMRV